MLLETGQQSTRDMSNEKSLFGGDRPWDQAEWTASDDRVRGGESQSYLECDASSDIARFHGTLDITTLGDAGFASQRTVEETKVWDFSGYDGIRLSFGRIDGKRYTLILKDSLLPKSPNGREQSTMSYEYDFQADDAAVSVGEGSIKRIFIPWTALKATYRGREKPDAPALNLSGIRRISIMMRSFFGTQEGDFSIEITSIALAYAGGDEAPLTFAENESDASDAIKQNEVEVRRKPGIMKCFPGQCSIS